MSAAVLPAERSLPYNLEAERSVLGAVLVTSGKAMDTVADLLRDQEFFRDAHQRIFRAMVAMYTRGFAIDFVTLNDELVKAGNLDEVGGAAYVSSLVDGVPASTNIAYYARIIRECASQRQVITLANRMLASAYERQATPAELVDEAERGLLDISAQAVPGDLTHASDMVRAIYPIVEQLHAARRPVTGLATGFAELDRYTRGFQPGDFIIIAARPSQGKTTIVTQVALHIARQGVPVAFFSVEMSQQAQMFRILATLAGVDGHDLQCGQLNMLEQQRVGDAMGTFSQSAFWLDESATVSALQIRSKARRLKARAGLSLIVVDYLQLLQHAKANSREEQVATTGRLLKAVARELKVPLIALSQLSRKVEDRTDRRPTLADLRESGSLEQDADLVLLMHRPPVQDEGGIQVIPPTELQIAKQRNGPTASLEFHWRREQYRFEPIEASS